ncbi:hypothetical protein [Planctomycetes bacterium CA13]|uniref:hypothetical protein n=1 Tax=Novipirellula herctigrandis TaxID=2527986 RepID=UPI0011B6B0A3
MKHRDLTARDGTTDLSEPEFWCASCERSFFPQRINLRFDGSSFSPAVSERIVAMGGTCGSFPIAARMIELLTDLKVAWRTVNDKTISIGSELAATREAATDAHLARPLTAQAKIVESVVSLAVAQVDGGRTNRTRDGGSRQR